MTYSKKEKEKILKKGLEIFKTDPAKLNPHYLAKELGISNAKVHYHFDDIRSAVLQYAIDKGDSPVIVGMIANKHPLVKNMSERQKQKHLKSI